jgi:hypothetical protein
MASSIGNIAQLVASIRSQLAAPSTPVSPAQVTRTRQNAIQSSNYSPENLESLIGQRIKQIERDDPHRGKKAFRVFLEVVLLSQLGEQLINDPKFYQLLDDVQTSIETDPEIGSLVDKATAHLLKQN